MLTVRSQNIFALIDSGAPVSLLSYEAYNALEPDLKSTLSTPTVKLSSVTGQAIEVIGTAKITFFLTETLQVSHQFQVTKGLQPYEAILGLDFLANPSNQIKHELPNFVLCFQQTPIPLFNANRQTPCATVLSVKAKGRHQYVGPRAVTFVRVQIDEKVDEIGQAQGYEFHPHPVTEGAPQPVRCFFGKSDMEKGDLLIGIINTSGQGMYVKNNEPVGFLTPVSTQPFLDMVAAVMSDRERDQSGHGPNTFDGNKRPHAQGSSQSQISDGEFLDAFKYGELSEEQRGKVQSLLLQYRDCFMLEGDSLGICNKVVHRVETTVK